MHVKSLIFSLVFLPFSASAVDIFAADKDYTQGNYEQAKQQYLAAAEVGNPHAYYQLGNMYFKGLGGEQDVINALLYFYLAAEQKFHNSEALITKILDSIPADNRTVVMTLLEEHKKTHGKQQIIAKYFPILNENNLQTKITFDGEPSLKTVYLPDDVDLQDFLPETDLNTLDIDDSEAFSDNPLIMPMSTPRSPFLIIDHDVDKDGSIRHSTEVQKFGFYQRLEEQFTLFPIAKPEFDGAAVDFASRTFLGAAAYNKFTLVEENPTIYQQIVKQTRKFKRGESISDKFNLAMLMLNFPWLEQGENEAEDILLDVSKKGHAPAMYEYGFKLFREQRDIEQAIHWIAEASKYGLIRAEYRLARLLQSSPWVINDERKALYWYESAMNKGNTKARIRAADILFTSKDESILNYELAVEYLSELEALGVNDPEYYYLQALKYKSGKHRDIKLAVENIERAILQGQLTNWDVSDWQALLREITTGSIFVTDYEN